MGINPDNNYILSSRFGIVPSWRKSQCFGFPTGCTVYNWMVDFFEHRKHRVVFDEEWSEFLEILASIIQGSGIGPASYVVNAGDLKTKNWQNKLVKFANDTYLIVPSSMEETRMEEIANISEWATRNNLTLNNSKTVEIIFSRPRSRRAITPPALIPGIARS